MNADHLYQAGLLLLEVLVVAGLLLLFFRLRSRFGIAPLCMTIGAYQQMQAGLAATLYVQVAPTIFISPGSSVLFTATLMVTLLVYIRDDAAKTQMLIVGIVAANLTLALFVWLVSMHLDSPGATLSKDFSSEYLMPDLWPLISGTALLSLEVILIIIAYEFFFRLFPRLLFFRIALALCSVVVLDTVLFVTAVFYGDDAYLNILRSALIGKLVASLLCAAIMTAYLYLVPAPSRTAAKGDQRLRDIFHILTYRQRYEQLKDKFARDPLTGLFNRGFFDENLPPEFARALRLGHHINVMLIDLDHFKEINDNHGHQVGDIVIQTMASSMQEVFRTADIPCRYGGEEFVVIMPDSTTMGALHAAERLRRRFRERCSELDLPMPVESITFTAGIASYPHDAQTPDDLLRVADERLYAGKRAGRDRVMIGEQALTESQSISVL